MWKKEIVFISTWTKPDTRGADKNFHMSGSIRYINKNTLLLLEGEMEWFKQRAMTSWAIIWPNKGMKWSGEKKNGKKKKKTYLCCRPVRTQGSLVEACSSFCWPPQGDWSGRNTIYPDRANNLQGKEEVKLERMSRDPHSAIQKKPSQLCSATRRLSVGHSNFAWARDIFPSWGPIARFRGSCACAQPQCLLWPSIKARRARY